MEFAWFKGHGTENDFIVLPDHDGTTFGDLDANLVAQMCDRRRGLGADGVLRVIRTSAIGLPSDGEWFMDYRNADGSISEMCGNGMRVFGRHLVDQDLAPEGEPFAVGTRDGDKIVTVQGEQVSVDMGQPDVRGTSTVGVDDHSWSAQDIRTGNPHAVAFVDDLADAGTLLAQPNFDASVYPEGVNIEFVVRRGPQHVAMRVHERGSGETRSCGTGACAVAVASALADQATVPTTYRVDVPGGTVEVTWREDQHMVLAGPAIMVASGTMEWLL
jgi:diaminopimelate epimerase